MGAAWLKIVAPTQDETALRVALAAVLSDLGGVDVARAAEGVSERVQAEFQGLRTVGVEGWTLSATEVVLAAVLDLDDDATP